MNVPSNPADRQEDLPAKIVFALERSGESIRLARAALAREVGLTDLQLRVLHYVAFHRQDPPGVSKLSAEFQISRPTVSETVRLLLKKELLSKEADPNDGRAFTLVVTKAGNALIGKLSKQRNDHLDTVRRMDEPERERLYASLYHLLHNFQTSGLVPTLRMCLDCKYFDKRNGGDYCGLLKIPLTTEKLRLDCPEFEQVT